jgi:hypothetical protein|tara:strand:+ start:76 stop:711 length:636 start_codon:yes stop_codon:yes gene_type:complete
MRTVRTKIYSFNELTEEAKQNAVNQYRNNNLNHDFIYDDAYKTVREFNKLFELKEGSRSWLDFSTNFENCIEDLNGLRLQKYIYNNFGYKLFKPSFIGSLKSNEIQNHKRIKSKKLNNGNVFNPYYSAIKKDNSCVLTGMCYDDDMLKPIYDFLNQREFNINETFETILKECFTAIEKIIEDDKEYRESDQAIIEEIESNDYEFLKEGTQY